MTKYKFKIDRKGNLKVLDVEGQGTGCLQATAKLEQRLGTADESSRQHTASFAVEPQELTITQ